MPRGAWLFALIAAPAFADGGATLDRLLAGRTAAAPVECITPDRTAQPRIIDGQAIVYFRGRTTYVARFEQPCPQLTQGRIAIVSGLGGRLCRHDPVRVVEATGAGYGFCTFDRFTPYAGR